ncbi:MAG: hypothetical protein KZQ58_06560 [gamma proteobacterium symbiont of Bathyaustriella thionipta]|nr:hypothetical protein [gamma proteobacterium symbiont of Bathyaustriella thionipta]
MKCDGIWKVEMIGSNGWERIATAFMKKGKYMAAGTNHYSVGSYTQDGDNVVISILLKQQGVLRTVFGIKSPSKLDITIKGKIRKDKITGKGKAKGAKKHEIQIRLSLLERFK